MFASVVHGQTIFRDIILPGGKCFIRNAGVYIEHCESGDEIDMEFIHKPMDTTKPSSVFNYKVKAGLSLFHIETVLQPGFLEVRLSKPEQAKEIQGIWFFYEWKIG